MISQQDTELEPCTCPKGGMYERENESTYVCEKCDGSEWVESLQSQGGK